MSRSPSLPRTRNTWLLFAVLLAPVLVCYAILYRNAISIPLLDDYDATLGFLLRQQAIHGFIPRLLACLADQQAEYKFILEHLLIAAQFGITGHLSLGLFILLGNLLLLPILYVFLSNVAPDTSGHTRLLALLPVPYLVCQLTDAEVFNWTVASLNALAVVAFVLLALHFLNRRSASSLAAACAAAAVACTASTNAFLAAPVGFVLLLSQRRWRAATAWSATFVAMLCVYLFRYQRVEHPPGPGLAIRGLFFLSFLGGSVENMHHRPVPGAAFLLGIVLLAVFLHATITGYARSNPVMLAIATWTLLTAITVAWFRSSFGVSQSLSGRYKLYCMLLLVFCYGYIAHRIRHARSLSAAQQRTRLRIAFAVCLLFYVSGTITGADFLSRRHRALILGMRHYLADPDHNTPLYPAGPTEINDPVLEQHLREVLEQSIAHGIYRIPPLPSVPTTR